MDFSTPPLICPENCSSKKAWLRRKKNQPTKTKTLSSITITSSNIRGTCLGKNYKETKKVNSFFSIFSDVHILIDHHLNKQKLDKWFSRHRQTLSKFSIHGFPTKERGILVFLHKASGCKISNIYQQ